MDPLNAFKTEVFRPIASIMLPGLIAIGPFAIVLGNAVPEVDLFFHKQALIYFLLLSGAATVTGMLLENFGSSIERGIDRCMELEYLPGTEEVWDLYLSSASTDTYARKYLGTIVTRLKFLNSLMPALLLLGIGLLVLHRQVHKLSGSTLLVILIVLGLTMLWLFRTSTELSEAAVNTRYRIVRDSMNSSFDPLAQAVGRQRHLGYVIGEVLTSRIDQIDLRGRYWFSVFQIAARLLRGK